MSNENSIGYCGFYCRDCINYWINSNLASDLRNELRKNKFAELANAMPFNEFDTLLTPTTIHLVMFDRYYTHE